MIAEFLKSQTGVILISIIWALGLSTLFKKSCEGNQCKVFTYKGPPQNETTGIWSFDEKNTSCYKLTPHTVTCQ